MKRFEFFDHTADVEFAAYGKDLESLFKNALLCMFGVIAKIGTLKRSCVAAIEIPIDDSADTIEDLLWYTLQDALSAAEAKRAFCYEIRNIKITCAKRYSVSAAIMCREKSDIAYKLEVKGVSRYNMSISKSGNIYKARVILDV